MARKSENQLDRVGEIVKTKLDQLKLNQDEAAKIAGVGSGTISHFIQGRRRSLEAAVSIFSALGLSLDDAFLSAKSNFKENHHNEKIVGFVGDETGEKPLGDASKTSLLKMTSEILESETVYRPALVSNIKAFYHGIEGEDEMGKMHDEMKEMKGDLSELKEMVKYIAGINDEKKSVGDDN